MKNGNETDYGKLSTRPRFSDRKEYVLQHKKLGDMRATYALSLAERFGAVACAETIKKAEGGKQMVLIEPKVFAKHACDIAQAMFDEIERRNWVMIVPEVTTDEQET